MYCFPLQDTTISRLTREIEGLKTEMKNKDTQLLSMQTKVRIIGQLYQ